MLTNGNDNNERVPGHQVPDDDAESRGIVGDDEDGVHLRVSKAAQIHATWPWKLAALAIDAILIGLLVFPYFKLFLIPDIGPGGNALWALRQTAFFSAALVSLVVLLLLATLVVKVVVVGRIVPGFHRNGSWFLLRWYIFDKLWTLLDIFVLSSLAGTPWLPMVYRLFGARVGSRVLLEQPCMRVPDLVDIGSDSCVESDVTLLTVHERANGVEFAQLKIGSRSVVHARAFLDLGCILEDCVDVGSLTHVPPGGVVRQGEHVGGTLMEVLSVSATQPTGDVHSTRSWLMFAVPVVLQLLSVVQLFAAIMIYGWLAMAFDDTKMLLVTVYLGLPILYVLLALIDGAVSWLLRRMLLWGRAKPGVCAVHSFAFARRWLAQELFAKSVAGLEHTVYGRMLARLQGAGMEVVGGSFVAMPPEPDLYSAGADLFVANGVVIRSFTVQGGSTMAQFGRISIGKSCMVLDRSVLMPGAVLGDTVTVGSGTVVRGDVALACGSLSFGNPPLTRQRGVVPFQAAATATWSQKALFMVVQDGVIFYLTTLISSTLVLPGFVALIAAASLDRVWLSYLAVVGLVPVLGVLAGAVLLSTGLVVKRLLGRRFIGLSGSALFSFGLVRWEAVNAVVHATCKIVAGVVDDFAFTRWMWRMMGADIASDVTIASSALILEAELLTLGHGTHIDEDATLFCHTFQNGKLEFRSVDLGERCKVGALSVVLPGSSVADDVEMSPLTQVMPDEALSSGKYAGSPAQWVAPC